MRAKKILATRKLADSLVANAAERGFEIDEVEMITVSSYPVETIAPVVNSITDGIVVFTSRNAVAAVADALKHVDTCRLWRIYTLCGATATAVVKHLHKQPESAEAKDGEQLASIIAAQEKPTDVFFFCGNLRRDVLPDLLIKRGFHVKEQVVYETKLNNIALNENYDGVLFFSPSAVRSFFEANKISNATVLFSIGETTAMEIKKFSSNKLVIAPDPSENTMIDLATSTANYT